jgi:hypothetical protein
VVRREKRTWLLTEYDPRTPATEGVLDGSGNPAVSGPTSPLTGDRGSPSSIAPKGSRSNIAAIPETDKGALQSRARPGDQPLFSPEEEDASRTADQSHKDQVLGATSPRN